ncbi:MAG: ATPase domain-containing protein [Candidatus Thermoplasmatota archaeon]|nr:ATPase domain-containing protein [Candidatus Thermoplasmatota archaeon]
MGSEVCHTGIEGLDKMLKDSLPEGYSMLVFGPPGSGIELFAKQFANAAGGKDLSSYVATEESTENIAHTMSMFGLKNQPQVVNFGEEYYEKVLARRLEVSKYREEGIRLDDIKEFTASQYESGRTVNFLTKLIYETSKMPPGFRMVVDSLNFFLEHYDLASVLSSLRTIRAHAQHNQGSILITFHGNVFRQTLKSGIEGLVDCIIELETTRVGVEFERNLVVHKVANHPEKTLIMRYHIGSAGIDVYK